jgi:hypothetical protein
MEQSGLSVIANAQKLSQLHIVWMEYAEEALKL